MSRDFDELVEMMARLRGEKGCPWDRKQTHDSLKPYLVEESYEVLEAIDLKDSEHLAEELGDLLLQVVFHARIADEAGAFTIERVISGLVEKLKKRHPHVFEGNGLATAEEVLKNWEKNKMIEKGEKRKSVLDGVPPSLPALMRAQKVQKKASRAGFDWARREGVVDKFEEEWREFKEALEKKDPEAIEEELGDLLFTLVNLSRSLKADAEQLLRQSTHKFVARFQAVEKEAKKKGKGLEALSPAEWDGLWNLVKGDESKKK